VIDVGRHANASLTVQAATNGPVVVSGPIVENAATGNGALIKVGAGLLRLTSTNSYAGGTTVSAGRLEVSNTQGSGTGPGGVIVGTTASLGGTGTVAGAVTVQGGATLSAGAVGATGALTVAGGLALSANSVFSVEVAGEGADRVRVTGGAIAVTRPVTVNVTVLAMPTSNDYSLLDWTGASGTPQVGDFALGSSPAGYSLVLRDSVLHLSRPSGTLMLLR